MTKKFIRKKNIFLIVSVIFKYQANVVKKYTENEIKIFLMQICN